MKMFELLIPGKWRCPTQGQLGNARKVYDRYKGWYEDRHGNADGVRTFEEFILCDVSHRGLSSFIWDKETLVRDKDENIGMTKGWDIVIGSGGSEIRVVVRNKNGDTYRKYDEIEEADIPLDVVEYVKGEVIGIVEKQVDENLRNRIHEKVDEAFNNK